MHPSSFCQLHRSLGPLVSRARAAPYAYPECLCAFLCVHARANNVCIYITYSGVVGGSVLGVGVASKCMQNTCHACPSRVLFIFITQSMQSFAHYFHSSLRSSYWNGVQNGIGGQGVPCSLLPAPCILSPAFLLQLSRLTCLINGRSCQEAALFVLLNLQATDWESFFPTSPLAI